MTPNRAGTAIISASWARRCGPSRRGVMTPAPKVSSDAITRVPTVPPTVTGLMPGSHERTRRRSLGARGGPLCAGGRLADVSKGSDPLDLAVASGTHDPSIYQE